MTPFFILLLAQAPPSPDVDRVASLLAPSPIDFDRTLAETAQLFENAEAIGAALATVQNVLGDRWSSTSTTAVAVAAAKPGTKPVAKPRIAEEPIEPTLALESVLLRDHRDAVQSLRASSERLERMAEAPTVAPVVSGARAVRVESLLASTRELVRVHVEMVAWHERFVRPRLARLKEQPRLEPGAGWSRRAPRASDDRIARVAIVGIGGGTICPDGFAADGRTVVLRNAVACVGGPDCTCVARPRLPGAVLAP